MNAFDGKYENGYQNKSKKNKNGSTLVTVILILAIVGVSVFIIKNAIDKRNQTAVNTIYSNGIVELVTAAPAIAVETPEPTQVPRTFETLAGEGENGCVPILYRANTDEKRIAITIDGASKSSKVEELLGVCGTYGAHITFFTSGDELTKLASLWPQVILAGHEIESHTYSNSRLAAMTDDEKAYQLDAHTSLLRSIVGEMYSPHFLRTDYLEDDDDASLSALLTERSFYAIVRWALDTPTELEQIGSGMILRFDLGSTSIETLKNVIWILSENGYEMVTLNELFALGDNFGD